MKRYGKKPISKRVAVRYFLTDLPNELITISDLVNRETKKPSIFRTV